MGLESRKKTIWKKVFVYFLPFRLNARYIFLRRAHINSF